MAALSRKVIQFTRLSAYNWCLTVLPSRYLPTSYSPNFLLSNKQDITVNQWRKFRSKAQDGRPHVNIGTIGHIDHGKTTLTAAITRVMSKEGQSKFMDYNDIDSAPQEQARGITINACHVEYSSKKRHYAHTDCPGHIDYIKNMICGASQMDGAILVIAATDGTMPQTQEHLSLAKLIGVKHIIIYVNKADIVDDEMLELVEIEARELLDSYGFDGSNAPVIHGSALCALEQTQNHIGKDSIFKLMDAIDEYVPTPVRDTSGPFLLPIEKSIPVQGRGTVAVGTLLRGTMQKGKEAELLGFGQRIKTALSDIQIFQKSVPICNAGENCGVLMRGVRGETVTRGMVLAEPGSVNIHDHFEATIYVRTRAEGGRKAPFTDRYINQLFIETWSIQACVLLPEDRTMAMPGDTFTANVILRKGMVIKEGQSFVMRDNDVTSVTGIISKILPDTDIKIKGFNQAAMKPMRIHGKAGSAVMRRRRK